MNPDYILPVFLDYCLVAVCVWNVVQTGTIRDLEDELDEADRYTKVDKDLLAEGQILLDAARLDAEEYKSLYENALDRLVEAVKKIPARGVGGRFKAKSK